MVNPNEQETNAPVQVEEVFSEQSQTTAETATASTKDTTSEEKEKRLSGQISALQKQIQQQSKVFEALKSVVSDDEEVATPEDTVKALQDKFVAMESELKLSKVEKQRDELIEGLELTDVVKKELKRRVTVSPNLDSEKLQSAIDAEVSALSELFEVQKKSTVSSDIRPTSQGSSSVKAPTNGSFTAWEKYMKDSGQLK